ncbi:hypothetical protein [Streptomyces sp. NPDC088258]|uniref:hypothetical protein n=1 Tax=Streptomyces sp. NPDC088258 TaxID=3365849 RepID=UPI0038291634
MTAVEDRLRAALHARANQVTAPGPAFPPSPRARTVIRTRLRKATTVLLVAALAAVLLVLPRLLSQGDPSVPADTPPPAGPSGSTSSSPASPPPDEAPRPVAP